MYCNKSKNCKFQNYFIKFSFTPYLVLSVIILLIIFTNSLFSKTNPLNCTKPISILNSNNYYVSTISCASDSNDGLSPTCSNGHGPFATIQHAADIAVAGDTIFICEGVYDEKIYLNNFGTNGNPITFINYQNDSPVIDWSGTVGSYHALFEMRGSPKYITIKGLKIQNSEEYGILAYGNSEYTCEDIIIDSVTILNSDDYAIYLEHCKDSKVSKSHLEESGASGIFISHSANITIDGNTVINARNVPNGHDEFISIADVNNYEAKNNEVYYQNMNGYFGALGIDAKQGSSNGSIHHNYIHDISEDAAIYIDAYDNSSPGSINNKVYNNKIKDCETGISIGTEEGGTIDSLDIYNNVIINTDKAGISFHDEGPNGSAGNRKNVRIYHNTIYSTVGGGWKCGILINIFTNDPNHLSNIYIDNNIVRYHRLQGSSDGYGQVCATQPIVDNQDAMNILVRKNLTTGIYYGTTALNSSSEIVADPLFVDSTNFNFHLQTSSPAIDSGLDASNYGLIDDYDEVSRPLLNNFDLGAYEFGIYWTGNNNNNWDNSGNWSNGQIPTVSDSVTIPPPQFYNFHPIINNNAHIKKIFLYNNAQLILNKNKRLDIND